MWLKNIWKLATQTCHRCTLKDQVHLITKTSATKLAHPLVSRHARLAANILWQPMTPVQNLKNRCIAAGQDKTSQEDYIIPASLAD